MRIPSCMKLSMLRGRATIGMSSDSIQYMLQHIQVCCIAAGDSSFSMSAWMLVSSRIELVTAGYLNSNYTNVCICGWMQVLFNLPAITAPESVLEITTPVTPGLLHALHPVLAGCVADIHSFIRPSDTVDIPVIFMYTVYQGPQLA